MAKLKVTQLRGLSGRTERQRQTIKCLGLRKRHDSVIVEDTQPIRGMIKKVMHLVSVENVEE